MARLILIFVAAFLLLASPPLRADELNPGEFPVSNERMAELIELAADWNLAIPDGQTPKEPMAARQVSFLRQITKSRKMASLGGDPGAYAVDRFDYDAETCYRAVMAARSGNHYAADILLERGFLTKFNRRDDYCMFLYQRWNGKALSYRFLLWWAQHVTGPHRVLGIFTLMVAAQFLPLPLLLKLRHSIKARGRGWPLIGLAMAVAFAEFVPICWVVASGPAWAVAYDLQGDLANDSLAFLRCFMLLAPSTSFLAFNIGCGRTISLRLTVALFVLLPVLTVLPFGALKDCGIMSKVGLTVADIFWSGTLVLVIYFLLLLRRERLRPRLI